MRINKTSLLSLIGITIFFSVLFLIPGCLDSQDDNNVEGKQKHLNESKNEKNSADSSSINIVRTGTGKVPEITGLNEGDIPLAYSPDFTSVFVMNYSDDVEDLDVIAGDYVRNVDLYKVDLGSSRKTKVASGIPFASLAKWSPDGRYLGLMGGEKLFVLNPVSGQLDDVNELVNTPSVVYFGWSPDSEKIYTEHKNLPNDSVYYVETRQGLPAYKIDDRKPYYKSILVEGTFIGTDMFADSYGSQTPMTVVLDRNGNIIKNVAVGRFRDIAGERVIQVGSENFGLTYIPNLNDGSGKMLDGEYIYQCEFTPSGNIIYTTKGEAKDELFYNLTIFYTESDRRKTVQVSGPHFSTWPDGKYVDICGYKEERLSLPDLKLVRVKNNGLYSGEESKIVAAVRGAADAYIKNYYIKPADRETLKKELQEYYVNTANPVPQEALFDVLEELSGRRYSFNTRHYHLNGVLKNISISGDRASVAASFGSCEDSVGSGWGFGSAFELVKLDGKWYVTGLSTFPDSAERKKVAVVVQSFVSAAKRGEKFYFKDEKSRALYEEIKGKDIRMGQIQFWAMSEPHRAQSLDYANYAKVYLDIGEKRYKLIVSKKGSWTWKIVRLGNKRIAWLF